MAKKSGSKKQTSPSPSSTTLLTTSTKGHDDDDNDYYDDDASSTTVLQQPVATSHSFSAVPITHSPTQIGLVASLSAPSLTTPTSSSTNSTILPPRSSSTPDLPPAASSSFSLSPLSPSRSSYTPLPLPSSPSSMSPSTSSIASSSVSTSSSSSASSCTSPASPVTPPSSPSSLSHASVSLSLSPPSLHELGAAMPVNNMLRGTDAVAVIPCNRLLAEWSRNLISIRMVNYKFPRVPLQEDWKAFRPAIDTKWNKAVGQVLTELMKAQLSQPAAKPTLQALFGLSRVDTIKTVMLLFLQKFDTVLIYIPYHASMLTNELANGLRVVNHKVFNPQFSFMGNVLLTKASIVPARGKEPAYFKLIGYDAREATQFLNSNLKGAMEELARRNPNELYQYCWTRDAYQEGPPTPIPGWQRNKKFMTTQFKSKFRCQEVTVHNFSSCPFFHGPTDYRRPITKDMEYDMKLCDKRQACSFLVAGGNFCPLAHNKTEMHYHPRFFRTILCKDEDRGRECKSKDVCPFKHVHDDELVDTPASSSSPAAPMFTTNPPAPLPDLGIAPLNVGGSAPSSYGSGGSNASSSPSHHSESSPSPEPSNIPVNPWSNLTLNLPPAPAASSASDPFGSSAHLMMMMTSSPEPMNRSRSSSAAAATTNSMHDMLVTSSDLLNRSRSSSTSVIADDLYFQENTIGGVGSHHDDSYRQIDNRISNLLFSGTYPLSSSASLSRSSSSSLSSTSSLSSSSLLSPTITGGISSSSLIDYDDYLPVTTPPPMFDDDEDDDDDIIGPSGLHDKSIIYEGDNNMIHSQLMGSRSSSNSSINSSSIFTSSPSNSLASSIESDSLFQHDTHHSSPLFYTPSSSRSDPGITDLSDIPPTDLRYGSASYAPASSSTSSSYISHTTSNMNNVRSPAAIPALLMHRLEALGAELGSIASLCSRCNIAPSAYVCDQCQHMNSVCGKCWDIVHNRIQALQHTATPIQYAPSIPSLLTSLRCEECERDIGHVYCAECDLVQCGMCYGAKLGRHRSVSPLASVLSSPSASSSGPSGRHHIVDLVTLHSTLSESSSDISGYSGRGAELPQQAPQRIHPRVRDTYSSDIFKSATHPPPVSRPGLGKPFTLFGSSGGGRDRTSAFSSAGAGEPSRPPAGSLTAFTRSLFSPPSHARSMTYPFPNVSALFGDGSHNPSSIHSPYPASATPRDEDRERSRSSSLGDDYGRLQNKYSAAAAAGAFYDSTQPSPNLSSSLSSASLYMSPFAHTDALFAPSPFSSLVTPPTQLQPSTIQSLLSSSSSSAYLPLPSAGSSSHGGSGGVSNNPSGPRPKELRKKKVKGKPVPIDQVFSIVSPSITRYGSVTLLPSHVMRGGYINEDDPMESFYRVLFFLDDYTSGDLENLVTGDRVAFERVTNPKFRQGESPEEERYKAIHVVCCEGDF